MVETSKRILLAEDDPHLGALLSEYLSSEGLEVMLCTDGEQALSQFSDKAFDLCLLDVMMPKMDGFTVAKNIRSKNQTIPIIFITARSLRQDKLKGYVTGADDYITKPFDEEELLWKIKAMVRRTEETRQQEPVSILNIGRYRFDPKNQSLEMEGLTRRITEKESEILKFLYEHRNQVIRRDEMVKELWGKSDYFLGRSLDVFITKIRKYLSSDPMLHIENIFRVGFCFHVPE